MRDNRTIWDAAFDWAVWTDLTSISPQAKLMIAE
jgi:hypothetical protein